MSGQRGKEPPRSVARGETPRQAEESEAGLERRRFFGVLDAIDDGVCIINQEYGLEYVNPALLKAYGPVQGRPCFEYFHGQAQPCQVCNPEVFAGQIARWEVTLDRTGKIYDMLAVPFPTTEGSVWKLEIFHDVTAHRQAEEALRQSEERYRSIVETTTEGVWVLDASGRTSFVNPQMAAMLGHTPAEMLGRALLDFVDEPERQEAGLKFEQRRNGIPELHDFKFRRKDGSSLHAVISANPLFGPSGNFEGALGMVTDITGRVEAEQERRMLEERLRHTQKLEAIGRLASGVAHDFNNVLTVILGSAQYLRSRLSSDHSFDADLEAIERAARHAVTLTQQLLTFSRRGPLQKPAVLELNEVVRAAEPIFRRLLGSPVELCLELSTEPCRVSIHRGQIEQLLMNLLLNGNDAMPDGGRLLLQTRLRQLDARQAELPPAVRPGPYVVLLVSDRGVGIPPELLEHIFDPFFTTKPAGKGTGLGLSTVYGIVQQAGGRISVRSQPGQGSSFEIELPAALPG